MAKSTIQKLWRLRYADVENVLPPKKISGKMESFLEDENGYMKKMIVDPTIQIEDFNCSDFNIVKLRKAGVPLDELHVPLNSRLAESIVESAIDKFENNSENFENFAKVEDVIES